MSVTQSLRSGEIICCPSSKKTAYLVDLAKYFKLSKGLNKCLIFFWINDNFHSVSFSIEKLSSHKILWKFGFIVFLILYDLGEVILDNKKLEGEKIKKITM